MSHDKAKTSAVNSILDFSLSDAIVYSSLDVDALALADKALLRSRYVTSMRMEEANKNARAWRKDKSTTKLAIRSGAEWTGRAVAEFEHLGMYADLLQPRLKWLGEKSNWPIAAPDLGLPFHMSAGVWSKVKEIDK